jgi:hypothetical protein
MVTASCKLRDWKLNVMTNSKEIREARAAAKSFAPFWKAAHKEMMNTFRAVQRYEEEL